MPELAPPRVRPTTRVPTPPPPPPPPLCQAPPRTRTHTLICLTGTANGTWRKFACPPPLLLFVVLYCRLHKYFFGCALQIPREKLCYVNPIVYSCMNKTQNKTQQNRNSLETGAIKLHFDFYCIQMIFFHFALPYSNYY